MKVAFIGHSYHRTTRSTAFFIEELRRRAEVELLWDESWLGKPEVDLGQILDRAFDAVVVLQVQKVAPVLARAGQRTSRSFRCSTAATPCRTPTGSGAETSRC